MAKNKKPKFLEKETPELLAMLKEILSDEDADTKKALKITEELESRQPGETGPLSVDEALRAAADQMTAALNGIKAAYNNEVAMMEDSDEEPEDIEEEPEEEEAPKTKGSKKSGKGEKKSKKAPEPEEDEDEDEDSDEDSDEDDDGDDYSDWSTKDLKKECRTRGIKVTKGMAKADMVKALEADDKE